MVQWVIPNDAILVEKKHYELVKRYLHAQLSFEMGVSIFATKGKLCSQDVIDKYWDLLDELSDANIFKHKYPLQNILGFSFRR